MLNLNILNKNKNSTQISQMLFIETLIQWNFVSSSMQNINFNETH